MAIYLKSDPKIKQIAAIIPLDAPLLRFCDILSSSGLVASKVFDQVKVIFDKANNTTKPTLEIAILSINALKSIEYSNI
ncbi:hypothetical protein ABIC84_005121 [Mucilaginibacter sp. 3215]